MALDVAVKGLLGHKGRVGLDRVVELAHRHLGLDVVYVSELAAGRRICRAVAGDGSSFRLLLGDGTPAARSFSRLLVDGSIPSVVPDTSAEARVAQLPQTSESRIGAFIGVPLQLSDGSLYGTLCGMNHEPDHTLSQRDLRFMAMLAELVIFDLDEQRRQERLRVDLSEVIENRALDIAYQPIVELRGGEVQGLEALARFRQPFGPPDQTFADAETVGLGLELERLAVSAAWEVMPWLRPDQYLAINVSPPVLVELARRTEQEWRDAPLTNLVVEVTEQAAVPSYTELRRLLAPLQERGLRIAVDDAGAGYASLHHVVELRPDFIKVDRSLVHGLAHDHARRVAVSAFVLLALDLGATVVAEGVEKPADLAALRDLGVHAAQGYLLARPSIDRADVVRWTAPSHAMAEFSGA